jgi:hypothetical protein
MERRVPNNAFLKELTGWNSKRNLDNIIGDIYLDVKRRIVSS